MLDCLIIGAGCAGLSAAVWCDELKLSCVVLERQSQTGGQLHWIHNPIRNHLGGVSAANGRAMYEAIKTHIINRRFELLCDAETKTVDLRLRRIELANNQHYEAGNIIIATGLRRRALNIAGEREFQRRGVYVSGSRDKDLIKGSRAVVIGGGDAATENALLLADVCPHVTLIHRGAHLRARTEFIERLNQTPNIRVLLNSEVKAIEGDNQVRAVQVKTFDTVVSLAAEAVVIRIGYQPNTEGFAGELELDEHGYIPVNSNHETGIKNVFAIGDVSNPLAPTISGAIGAGATIAKTVEARKRLAIHKT